MLGLGLGLGLAQQGRVSASAIIEPQPKAEGGTIVRSGGYFYHIFLESGSFTPTEALEVEYLLVGGGGSGHGGNKANYSGGGGGAGGVIWGSLTAEAALAAAQHDVVVAEQAAAVSSGYYSSLTVNGGALLLKAWGGGKGGWANNSVDGSQGASGGGAANVPTDYGHGLGGQGNKQTDTDNDISPLPPYQGNDGGRGLYAVAKAGGGGGGVKDANADGTGTGKGEDAHADGAVFHAGKGGDGILLTDIWEDADYEALEVPEGFGCGAGGGANILVTANIAGIGGSPNGVAGVTGATGNNAPANTGNGGGGYVGFTASGGLGASGIVIIRYAEDAPLKVYQASAETRHIYIRSSFDATNDIITVMDTQHRNGIGFPVSDSTPANQAKMYFIPKATAFTGSIAGLTAVKVTPDDEAPAKLNDSYCTGTHGWTKAYRLTKTGHGLTYADIGTVWEWRTEDGGDDTQYVLISIYDANNITLLGKDTGLTDVFVLPQTITGATGTLTEVGGAERTYAWTAFNNGIQIVDLATSPTGDAKCEPIATPTTTILLDGYRPMTYGAEIPCKFVDLRAIYDVVHLGDLEDYLITQVGSMATNPTRAALADAITADTIRRWHRVDITYRLQDYGAMIVDTTHTCLLDTKVQAINFMQAFSPLVNPVGGKLYFYVPKVAVTKATFNHNKNQAVLPTDNWNVIDTDMEVEGDYVDRSIYLVEDSGGNPYTAWAEGFNTTIGDATQAKRDTQSTGNIWNINGGSIPKSNYTIVRTVGVGGVVAADTTFRAIGYRQLYKVGLWSGNATSVYFNESEDGDGVPCLWVYIDYHGSTAITNDIVTLPDKYVGKAFTVYEKSATITMNSAGTIPAGGLSLTMTPVETIMEYGFCVVKVIL